MQFPYLVRIVGIFLINLSLHVQANAWTGQAPLNPGCITSGEQWVLFDHLPSTITATVATDGPNPGNYNYQWQSSTDNTFFTDIPGATSQNLSFTTPPAETRWYQRKVTCGNEVAYTGTVKVNMVAILYYNVVTSGNFTRNDCSTGGVGATVTYTVAANTYMSPYSQTDADQKAQNDVNFYGQSYANAHGVCTWYNVLKSAPFTKSNCSAGGTGGSVVYTVPAGTYSSTSSQTDADQKAQNDVNTNGQNYANSNGSCTWYNVATSGTFTKNDCPLAATPTSVVYTVPANSYSSNISQADANAKAQSDVNANGQTYANNNGSCINLFISNRPGGTSAGAFAVSIKNTSGTLLYSKSTESDFLPFSHAVVPLETSYRVDIIGMSPLYVWVNGAQKLISPPATSSWNTSSVINIQVSGSFLYDNVTKSGAFTRNNCGSGLVGSQVVYNVWSGTYSSAISQADADQKAQNDVNANGQAYANANGTCSVPHYVNVAKSGVFTRNNCPSGFFGSQVTYTVPAGIYTSAISQADANQQAQNDVNTNGQTYADSHGTCSQYVNVVKSGTFTRNNCGSAATGGQATYTVAAGTYSSTISQADADQKAQNDVNNNGQSYANSHGLCTPITATVTLKMAFLSTFPNPVRVDFIQGGVVKQSNTFPASKNGSTNITVPIGSYTMVFTVPSSWAGAPISYGMTPSGGTWSPTNNSTTTTTETVTFNNGTAYTITAGNL
jgi:hypothetical protein